MKLLKRAVAFKVPPTEGTLTETYEHLIPGANIPGGVQSAGKLMDATSKLSLAIAAFLGLGVGASCSLGSLESELGPSGPRPAPGHAAGGRIAFIAQADPGDSWSRALYVMNPDGSDAKPLDQHVTGPIAWSPDATMIAYSHATDHEAGIYVAEPESGRVTRLTSTSGWDGYPAWSPDGTKIAFVHNHCTLRVADLAKCAWRSMSRVSGRVDSHAWTPDSRYVYFRGEDAGTKRRFFDVVYSDWFLYRVDILTGSQERVTEDQGLEAGPSPDGSRLALILDRRDDRALFLANPDGSNLQPLPIAGYRPQGISWAPQGDRLLVEALPSDERSGLVGASLFVIEIGNKSTRRLAEKGVGWGSPSWSPDGTKVLYERSGKLAVYDLKAENEAVSREGSYPRWSP